MSDEPGFGKETRSTVEIEPHPHRPRSVLYDLTCVDCGLGPDAQVHQPQSDNSRAENDG